MTLYFIFICFIKVYEIELHAIYRIEILRDFIYIALFSFSSPE